MSLKYDPTKAHSFTERGLTVELNPKEVHPDDPGQGAPVLVRKGFRHSASFNVALEYGELSGGESLLSKAQVRWLQRIEPDVNAWLEAATELARK